MNKENLHDLKTEYIYVSVVFGSGTKRYCYRTNDTSIKKGDRVVVPVGFENEEKVAKVKKVSHHTIDTVPYPPEKTKFVIEKIHQKESVRDREIQNRVKLYNEYADDGKSRFSYRKKILVGVALLIILALPFVQKAIKNYEAVRSYEKACLLMQNESYEVALTELENIKGEKYKDTDGLINLCKAYIAHNCGDAAGAYYYLKKAKFSYLTEGEMLKIDAFRLKLWEEYDKYLDELIDVK